MLASRRLPVLASLALTGLAVWLWLRPSEIVAPPPALAPAARTEPTCEDRDAVALVTQAGGRIATLSAVGDDLVKALKPDGPPADEDRDAWRRYARGLEPLETALSKPASLHAEWDGRGDMPVLIPWQWLGSALIVRGWDRGLDADVEAGLGDMLLAVELGRRTRGTSTWVVPTLVGDGIINRAATEIEQFVRTFGSADPGLHASAVAGLGAALADPPLLWRAVQSDCASWIRNDVSAFAAQPYIEVPALWIGRVTLPPALAPFLLDTSATFAEGTRLCDQQAAVAKLPYPDRPPQPLPAPVEDEWYRNRAGNTILAGTVDYPGTLVREDQSRARVAGVWSVLSARRYWLENGVMPSSTELPLPRDPFTDRPFAIREGVILSAGDAATHPNTPLRWVVLP